MNTAIITSTANQIGNVIKNHAPQILAVVGTIGIGTGVVLACKATTKIDPVLEKTKSDIDAIHEAAENGVTQAGEEYSPEDKSKDLAVTYAKTGIELVKIYAPAVGVCVLSVGCLLTSNHILNKRNVALTAAYMTLDKGYNEYRGRVVERFGDNVDRELKYGIKAQKITETEVDPETGKEKKVKKTVDVIENLDAYSDYSKFFDDASPYWKDCAEYNRSYLNSQQAWFNKRLEQKGVVVLNEVYDALGIPQTVAGMTVGWVYDYKNKNNPKNVVDFGIYDVHRPASRDFVNGYEKCVLLDFRNLCLITKSEKLNMPRI